MAEGLIEYAKDCIVIERSLFLGEAAPHRTPKDHQQRDTNLVSLMGLAICFGKLW
jgi:hypothetical protein